MPTIEGFQECMTWLDKGANEDLLKVTQKAMKDASRTTVQRIRQATPKRWKTLVKGKVKKLDSGMINAGLGLYNNHKRQGSHQHYKNGELQPEVDDWFKAYWANYGTQEHRDPEHKFIYARKRNTKTRSHGQPAQHFFEAATEGYDATFLKAFEASIDKQHNDLYK